MTTKFTASITVHGDLEAVAVNHGLEPLELIRSSLKAHLWPHGLSADVTVKASAKKAPPKK